MQVSQATCHHKWGQFVPLVLLIALGGCAATKSRDQVHTTTSVETLDQQSPAVHRPPAAADQDDEANDFTLAAYDGMLLSDRDTSTAIEGGRNVATIERPADEDVSESIEDLPAPNADRSDLDLPTSDLSEDDSPAPDLGRAAITLRDVVASIHSTFPLLEAAYQQYRITEGNQIAAWGAFDTKLKASSENGPLGFYETYRHGAGFSRPIL